VFGGRRDGFGKSEREPGRSRQQIFQRNEPQSALWKFKNGGAMHGPIRRSENVCAEGALGIDELQHRFARRRQRMNVPDEEIIAQTFRNAIE